MRCNTQQPGAEKVAYLCGICNPVHTPATPDGSLVMSRSAVRVRSSAPYFACKTRKKGRPPTRTSGALSTVHQQYTLTVIGVRSYPPARLESGGCSESHLCSAERGRRVCKRSRHRWSSRQRFSASTSVPNSMLTSSPMCFSQSTITGTASTFSIAASQKLRSSQIQASTYEPSSSLASITSISPGKFSFAASTIVSRFARNGCSWSRSMTYLPNSRVLLNMTSFSAVDTMTILNQPLSVLPLASATSRSGLDEAHKMALRVGEHRDARAVRHVHRPHHPAPTEALDLAQCRLEVPDLHVEGDVALASFRGRADAAVDATLYAGVRHRVARARRQHLPVKRVPIEALESLAVLADDLDVHYWVTHQLLLSVPPFYRCG